MRFCLFIFVVFSIVARGQDKLFFSNGTIKNGIIVSMTKEVVYFKNTDTSALQKINKSELLMSENKRGIRYIFYKQENIATVPFPKKIKWKENAIGVQPLALFIGRATFVYERYIHEGKIGLVFPLSITFDPFGSLYNSRLDTNKNATKRISGINFIGGIDVNFYLGKEDNPQIFVGPRIRYGTDLFLRGIEAYTIQTQVGLRFGEPDDFLAQHLSIGFGFANIVSSIAGSGIQNRRFYGWYSVNYRVGIGW